MYRIALVVDEDFGPRLPDLSRERYVWVVNSACNDPWVERLWKAQPSSPGDPLLCGVSSFSRQPKETDEDLVMNLLEMIDEHHGEFAHDPPWSEIEVFGTHKSERVVGAAQSYGSVRIEETPEGFRLLR